MPNSMVGPPACAARERVVIELAQNSQEFPRLAVISRKYLGEILIPQMMRDAFRHHLPEIGGKSQISAFIQLRLIQPRPASIDSTAAHRTT